MRLLAMALLHRYGHLRWYLQRLPAPGATTLEALASQWFGADAGG
jgi:hygromycin-B 7''-O-kinase